MQSWPSEAIQSIIRTSIRTSRPTGNRPRTIDTLDHAAIPRLLALIHIDRTERTSICSSIGGSADCAKIAVGAARRSRDCLFLPLQQLVARPAEVGQSHRTAAVVVSPPHDDCGRPLVQTDPRPRSCLFTQVDEDSRCRVGLGLILKVGRHGDPYTATTWTMVPARKEGPRRRGGGVMPAERLPDIRPKCDGRSHRPWMLTLVCHRDELQPPAS